MTEPTVRLLRYPVALGMSVVEHVGEWLREFSLMSLADDAGTSRSEVPARLQQTVRLLSSRYAAELREPDRLRTAAAARGDAAVDLVYPLRPETAQAALGWRDLLLEVDRYCAAEELLTLQRTPEQVALGDWMTEEFVRQAAGGAPRPWPGTGAAAPQPS